MFHVFDWFSYSVSIFLWGLFTLVWPGLIGYENRRSGIGEGQVAPMGAGRLQVLAVPLYCNLSCCSPHEQYQLTPAVWHKATPGLALHSHAYGQRRQKGVNSTVIRAAIVEDLAAVAVAAATVLPMCWIYMNRSQLANNFASRPSTSSSSSHDAMAPVCTSSTAVAGPVISSETGCAEGVTNGEGNDMADIAVNGFVANSQTQCQPPVNRLRGVEDHWLAAANHETVVTSATSVDLGKILAADGRNTRGVASSSTISWLEPNVHDTEDSSLPSLSADPAYPEFSGLLADIVVSGWSSDSGGEDKSQITGDHFGSESLAFTPKPNDNELIGGRIEVVDTSVGIDIGCREILSPEVTDVSDHPDISSELDNPVYGMGKISGLVVPDVKVNGVSCGMLAAGETTSWNGKVVSNGALSRSSTGRQEAPELADGSSVLGDGLEDNLAATDGTGQGVIVGDSDSGETGVRVDLGDTVRSIWEQDQTGSNERKSDVVVTSSSVGDRVVEGLIGKVNGQGVEPSPFVLSEASLAKKRSLTKVKKKITATTRICTEVPQNLSDVFPLDDSIGPEQYLKLYETFLRAGRLEDCVVLLEEMDKLKILRTDKIYHSKFFKACQRGRAVKEAFRFMRLLNRPTLSIFNMLLCVCRDARDVEGGLRVLSATEKAGYKPDSILYTTLISTCAKAGKVDVAFKVFHEMETAGVVPNTQTYGAMIDGCARAGQIAKAFGVYGIMISKKLKPDLVIFNTLINACGRAGAIERAFDVLADMKADPCYFKPNHVTIGALISACARAGQVDRAFEVYRSMQQWGIKGTPECYTAAVHACGCTGDLDLALSVCEDMKRDGVKPDEIFFSALIDVAGRSKQVDAAFHILQDMKKVKIIPGATTYSAIMGVCCNTGNWERALEVYKEVRGANLLPTVSTFNALITSLCDAKKIEESFSVLQEMKEAGVQADQITYSILLEACERLDEPERAFDLYTSGRADGVPPNQAMCHSVIAICYARIKKRVSSPNYPYSIGLLAGQTNEAPYEQWASWALAVYRHTMAANVVPTIKSLSLLLGCLRIPEEQHEKNGLFDDSYSHGVNSRLRHSSILDGAGFYDPRALAIFEEAASMGVVPHMNYTAGPIIVNAEFMPSYVAEVYMVTLLKGLKQRHTAGAQLFPVTINFLTEEKQILTATKEVKEVTMSGRTGQAVAGLLRRLRLHCQGHESSGKLRIATASIRKWLKPVTISSPTFPTFQRHHEVGPLGPPHTFLAQGIAEQQRAIRMSQLAKNSADIERLPGESSVFKMYRSQREASEVNRWDYRENKDFGSAERINGVGQNVSRKGIVGKRRS